MSLSTCLPGPGPGLHARAHRSIAAVGGTHGAAQGCIRTPRDHVKQGVHGVRHCAILWHGWGLGLLPWEASTRSSTCSPGMLAFMGMHERGS